MHIHANNDVSRLLLANTRPGSSGAAQPSAANLAPTDPDAPAGLTADAPAEENSSVSLAELLKSWGKNDGAADLNQDGEVNAADLAILLGGLGGDEPEPDPSPALDVASTPPAETGEAPSTLDAVNETTAPIASATEAPAADPTPPSEPPTDVQQLLKAWGQKDSDYDLNGDGTVNAADLAMLLGGHQIAEDADLQKTIGELAATNAPAEKDTSDELPGVAARLPQAIANAIFKANGHEGADSIAISDLEGPPGILRNLDRDGDGYIQRADLESLIADRLKNALEHDSETKLGMFAKRMYETFTDFPAAATPAPAKDVKPGQYMPRPFAVNSSQLKQAADVLGSKLHQMGFETKPPMNIGEVLDSFKLNNAEKKIMLNHLARRFPDGLGVNQVG